MYSTYRSKSTDCTPPSISRGSPVAEDISTVPGSSPGSIMTSVGSSGAFFFGAAMNPSTKLGCPKSSIGTPKSGLAVAVCIARTAGPAGEVPRLFKRSPAVCARPDIRTIKVSRKYSRRFGELTYCGPLESSETQLISRSHRATNVEFAVIVTTVPGW